MKSQIKLGVFLSMYGSLIKNADIDPVPNFAHVRLTAELAEYYKFHSVWATDHLLNPKLSESDSAWEAWTTISALASITSRVKLGHTVLCQAFRNPALVAKMVSTIDHICGGRFIFALGAGNYQREFQAYGMDWREHDELVDQGAEQLQLMKRLWSEPKVNFRGKYYQIEGGIVEPKPIQKPYPPIAWGGTSQSSQKTAAEHADIWFMKDSTVEQVKVNISSINKYLNGRQIEIGMGLMLITGESDDSAYRKLVRMVNGDEKYANEIAQLSLIGSPQTIANKITELENAGLNYILLKPAPTIGTLVDFGESVLPLL